MQVLVRLKNRFDSLARSVTKHGAFRGVMINMKCKRCGFEFYTASPESIRKCPYCGFDFQSGSPIRRKDERAEIKKNCVLVKGALRLDATATDISQNGVGIMVNKEAPLSINDTIHVIIEDLDIDSLARVVWIRKDKETKTETGLAFNYQ